MGGHLQALLPTESDQVRSNEYATNDVDNRCKYTPASPHVDSQQPR